MKKYITILTLLLLSLFINVISSDADDKASTDVLLKTLQKTVIENFNKIVLIKNYRENYVSYSTGLLISEDGYILTHVSAIFENSKTLILYKNKEYSVKIIGRDEGTYIAVLKGDFKADSCVELKQDPENIPPNVLLISTFMSPEQQGFAFIQPAELYYLNEFLPKGGQFWSKDEDYKLLKPEFYTEDGKLFQWKFKDKAGLLFITRGGLITDLKGKIFGMTKELKYVNVNDNIILGSEIVSFNAISHIVESIIKEGKYIRAQIGIMMVEYEGKPLIAKFTENSPAEQNGLSIGDQIIKLNGTEIKSTGHFLKLMDKVRPGDTIEITTKRMDVVKVVKITTLKNK